MSDTFPPDPRRAGSARRIDASPAGASLPDSQLQFVQDPAKYRTQGTTASVSVTAGTPGGGAPRGTPGPAVKRDRLITVIVVLAILGAVLGVVWHVVTPADQLAVWNGVEWLPQDPSLWLRQDLTFAALAAVAGLLTGGALVARAARPHPVRRLAAYLIGSGAGVAAMLGVGMLLAPAGATGPAGTEGPAPLTLHAWGFAGVWPLAAMAVTALLLVLRSFSSR